MSDGNFNRSMLPYNNYQSGLRAGKAQMKHIALDAFRKWAVQQYPELDDAGIDQLCHDYKTFLD